MVVMVFPRRKRAILSGYMWPLVMIIQVPAAMIGYCDKQAVSEEARLRIRRA